MLFFVTRNGSSSYLILILLGCARLCQSSGVRRHDDGPVRYTNATTLSISSPSITTSLETETVSPIQASSWGGNEPTSASTTVSSSSRSSLTTSSPYNTITTPPAWGNQTIPVNLCTTEINSRLEWIASGACHVSAGTVRLSYFPAPSGNVSYPSTWYNPTLSITMTSPSIYMVVNTISGYNWCGALGPTFSSAVISMDITDVSTLQPYSDAAAATRMGGPQQLTLTDLEHCPKTEKEPENIWSKIFDPHPNKDQYNRCNPHLVMPLQMKQLGYPYWMDCAADNYEIGIFDPPGAVPTVTGFFGAAASSSTQALTTSAPAANPIPTALPDLAPSTTSLPASTPTPPPSNSAVAIPAPSAPDQASVQPASSQVVPPYSSIIGVLGSNTVSALPSSPAIVIGSSTVNVGSQATLTDSTGDIVTVSVGSSGVVFAASGSSVTYTPNPAPATPSSTAVAATGVAIIATVGGQPVSASPGASSLLLGSQTITAGGPPITITGSNEVATLGSSALIVAYPSGVVSTYLLPTVGPSPTAVVNPISGASVSPGQPVVIGTIGSIAVTATPGASSILIGSQTVTIGGTPITVGNDVVTAAPSAIIVQEPGGVVSTLTIPVIPVAATQSAANKAAISSSSSSSPGLASIIASIAGIAPPSPSPSSSSNFIPTISVLTPSTLSTSPVSLSTIYSTSTSTTWTTPSRTWEGEQTSSSTSSINEIPLGGINLPTYSSSSPSPTQSATASGKNAATLNSGGYRISGGVGWMFICAGIGVLFLRS